MKKYNAKEIERFLTILDSLLAKKVKIIIIGGTAAALAYKVSNVTQDIDTWNSTKELLNAIKKAQEITKLNIPVGQANVADAPYLFEERLIPFKPEYYKKLQIFVPEVIDLILMKTLRAYEHDLDAIEQMVKNQKVKSNNLFKRYTQELNSAVGDKRKLDLNFLAMIERCFGSSIADKLETKLFKSS